MNSVGGTVIGFALGLLIATYVVHQDYSSYLTAEFKRGFASGFKASMEMEGEKRCEVYRNKVVKWEQAQPNYTELPNSSEFKE